MTATTVSARGDAPPCDTAPMPAHLAESVAEIYGGLPAISATARSIGADAAAEQRELLCLLLDPKDELSGFARRGLLMRVLQLSDLQADLFEGTSDDHVVTEALVGVPGEAVRLSLAMQAERAANATTEKGVAHG